MRSQLCLLYRILTPLNYNPKKSSPTAQRQLGRQCKGLWYRYRNPPPLPSTSLIREPPPSDPTRTSNPERSIFLAYDQKPSHHPNSHPQAATTPNPKPIGIYGWRVCIDRRDLAGLGRRPGGGLLTDRMARRQHVAGGGPGLFVLTRGSGLWRPTNKGV